MKTGTIRNWQEEMVGDACLNNVPQVYEVASQTQLGDSPTDLHDSRSLPSVEEVEVLLQVPFIASRSLLRMRATEEIAN